MRTVEVALARGDGSGPEMMDVASCVTIEAAKKDDIEIVFVHTPMGWCAFEEFGDTLPAESLRRATEHGVLFFGGVGEKALDKTLGKQHPKMLPEGRCLLTIRNEWGLLINERPAVFHPELRSIARVRPDLIPDAGIRQIWLRYLLEDTYFGTRYFINRLDPVAIQTLGLKLKDDVRGTEAVVSDIGYYTLESLERYFRYAFNHARELGLPLICIDKKNVSARYVLWRLTAERIGSKEFSDVELRFHYVDDANGLLSELHGVIACGNEHGDILSDGALRSVGSMGLMHSTAKNIVNGMLMAESGAGTYPEAKGKNIANPIGRILTGGMLLKHIGAVKGAAAIERATKQVLVEGFRTPDLVAGGAQIGVRMVGTYEMGEQIMRRL